jgi:hypothetical protein
MRRRDAPALPLSQKITSGEVEYPKGHTGEPEEGNALLCCSVPKGGKDLVIDA